MKTLTRLTILILAIIFYACGTNTARKTQSKNLKSSHTPVFARFNSGNYVAPQKLKQAQKRIVFDSSYFSDDITSEYYKIKIGMNLSTVKAILKKEHYETLSHRKKENMIMYKFKLLNSNFKRTPEYAIAFAKVLKVNILAMYYENKALFLFFYNKTLYSVKLREENVNSKRFYSVLKMFTRELKYGESITNENNRFGKKFVVYKNDSSKLEYHYYNLDSSTEITHYYSKPVKKIQNKINFKIRQIITKNKSRSKFVASR